MSIFLRGAPSIYVKFCITGRSCFGKLVADISNHDDAAYVAYSPALQLSAQASSLDDSVTRLGYRALDSVSSSMRQPGGLDMALSAWSRSEHANRFAAEAAIDEFCQNIGERARAVFRFSPRDNTGHARCENVPEYLAV